MVVSAVALVVALVALLLALTPLPATTLAPQLALAPGIGVGLGESSPAAPGPTLALSPAHAAAGGRALAVAESTAEGRPELVANVTAARAVSAAVANPPLGVAGEPEAPTPETPMQTLPEPRAASGPEAVAAPAETPAPEPVAATPVQVPYAPGFQPGPVAAGIVPPPSMPAEPIEVGEGDEGSVSYPFLVGPTSFRAPDEDNSILRFSDPEGAPPTFALQLWDDGTGQRGLWSSGEAMGGERFLVPLAEGAHELTVEYVASSEEAGMYLIALDGLTIDWRAWVSLLPPSGFAWLETGP